MREFGNVLTAMVTPFDRDLNVDYRKTRALARRLAGTGSDGIVVAGTTGESPTLTKEEKLGIFQAVLEEVGDKVAVLAGTGTNSTRASIELTRAAEKVGVHGIMLVAPYYNKPPQEGLYQHFKAIAGSTSLPVMLYNVPGRTSVNITPDTIARLSEIPNIVAVKEASGIMDQVTEIRKRTGPEFAIYSGDDSLTLPVLAVGGIGVVSVASHIAGPEIKEMVTAFLSGNVARAIEINLRLFPLFRGLFITTNPIPVKKSLALTGFDVGGVRLPLTEPGEKDLTHIRSVLADIGLIAG